MKIGSKRNSYSFIQSIVHNHPLRLTLWLSAFFIAALNYSPEAKQQILTPIPANTIYVSQFVAVSIAHFC